MNPIGIAGLAIAASCLPAAAVAWAGIRIAKETARAIGASEPVDESTSANRNSEDPESLLAWLQELPAVRSEDGAEAARDCGEVQAQ